MTAVVFLAGTLSGIGHAQQFNLTGQQEKVGIIYKNMSTGGVTYRNNGVFKDPMVIDVAADTGAPAPSAGDDLYVSLTATLDDEGWRRLIGYVTGMEVYLTHCRKEATGSHYELQAEDAEESFDCGQLTLRPGDRVKIILRGTATSTVQCPCWSVGRFNHLFTYFGAPAGHGVNDCGRWSNGPSSPSLTAGLSGTPQAPICSLLMLDGSGKKLAFDVHSPITQEQRDVCMQELETFCAQ